MSLIVTIQLEGSSASPCVCHPRSRSKEAAAARPHLGSLLLPDGLTARTRQDYIAKAFELAPVAAVQQLVFVVHRMLHAHRR